MPTLGELINSMALKAGVPADNEELKALLTAPELTTIKIPDELNSTIDKNLLSLEAANNNHPAIRAKYHSQFWDGIEKFLGRTIEDAGFTDQDMAEIKAAAKTGDRMEVIISKLKAAKGKPGADKEGLNAKIEQLNNELRLEKEAKVKILSETETKIKDAALKTVINSIYSKYKTMYDEIPGDSDGSIRTTTLDAIIQKNLKDKNARLTIDETGNLLLVGNDGSNVFGNNNVKLTPTSFLDQSFAPILKVSNSAGTNNAANQQRQQQTSPTKAADEKAEALVSQISSHNAKVIADMSAAPASLV